MERKTKIVGILNVTPDSFYDGGKVDGVDAAVVRALEMVSEGADVIDVGGESTRPGSDPVSVDEEISRVAPVIKKLSKECGVPISIDSYKPEVVSKALEAGASMINDVYGLRSPGMLELAAESKLPIILMHMQGTPKNMQENPTYGDVVEDIKKFFKERLAAAEASGIKKENIILDPGVGFGKTLEHNLEILRRLEEFKELGCRILVGPSRKSFIGTITGAPPAERLAGTLASVVASILNGADFVRVHDVAETVQAACVAENIFIKD